jgi:tRNA U34 5-carboxymethylaminomethyl modifying GTPase MnmE/TrmE
VDENDDIETADLLFLAIFAMSSNALPNLTNLAQAQEEQAETPPKKARKKPRGRVPNHYGKLGLSAKQKETIYAIQAKYQEEISALEKQLQELEEKEAEEVSKTLTDEQKESLRKILEEVQSRKQKTAK